MLGPVNWVNFILLRVTEDLCEHAILNKGQTWEENNKREWKPLNWFLLNKVSAQPLSRLQSIDLCYCLRKHVRFCEPGIVTFSRRHFLFLCSLNWNWWGSRQLKMLKTWFSLIWSQFQFLVIIDYFFGKTHIESMLYALTQQEQELLSNRYGTRPRNTCTIRQRVFNYPISPHVVHKSVELSGVGSLTH